MSELVFSSQSLREAVGFWSGAIAGVTVVMFGLYLLHTGQSQNIATWSTLAMLDSAIFYSSWKVGSKSAKLVASYAIGATIVTFFSLYNASWDWRWIETITVLGAACTLAVRARLSDDGAIIAGVVTMTIGMYPLLCDNWEQPFHASWWLWGICALCNLASLYGIERCSIKDCLFPVAGSLLNAAMFVLVVW